MRSRKDIQLEIIKRKAEREAGRLAGEFVRAASQDKEDILAALKFQQWLAQTCAACLEH